MLTPKKVKHRKWHKGRGRKQHPATRTVTLAFGDIGLKAMGEAWMTARQIEAARRVITRVTRKSGRLWIRVFPDHPVTTKGNEVPMGGGKGGVDHYVAVVRPGMVLFELGGVDHAAAREILVHASSKLPVGTRVVERMNR